MTNSFENRILNVCRSIRSNFLPLLSTPGQPAIFGVSLLAPLWLLTETHIRVFAAGVPLSKSGIVVLGSAAAILIGSAIAGATRRFFRKSESYKEIFENAPIGIYRTTPDGQILAANPPLIRMLGYSSFEDLASQNLESNNSYQPDYSRDEFKTLMERDGEVRGFEHSWRRKDGTILFVRENARAIRGPNGAILYYEGSVEDVTDRKLKEDEISRSRDKYRKLFENANDAILVLEPNSGNILAANDQAAGLYGYTRTDLTANSISGLAKDSVRERRMIDDLLRSHQTFHGETVHCNISGKELQLQASGSIVDYNGQEAVLLSLRDISERVAAEQALRESQGLLKSVIDSIPHPIFCKDLTGAYILVNRTFCKTSGNPEEKVIGKRDSDFFPKDIAEQHAANERAVIESGKSLGTVEEYESSRGGNLVFETVLSPRIDHNGDVAGILGLSSDITARRSAEKAVAYERGLLDALMNSIPDCIFFKDESGAFLRINKSLADLLHLPDTDSAIGKTTADFFGNEYALRTNEEDRQILVSDAPLIDAEESLTLADGSKRWLSTTKAQVRSEEGTFRGLVGISRDITEKKLAETSLEKNLESLLGVVSLVSEGDLTLRGSVTGDTLGKIAGSVNRMLESFSAMITRVKYIGLSVSSSATQILAASEEIASGAQRQADEVTNTSSTVEEMAATMGQVSRNAEASTEAARQALHMAEAGERSVRDTSDAMSRIHTAVTETAEKMKTLAKRSSEISEIMDLINEVAAQTNLLSLNAAIEAAHAGEAGLGFSVVAEEIRKLAERSARATREVGSIIRAIQEESAAALTAMENGIKEVSNGTSRSEQASRSLQDIHKVVKQSADLIEEISAAAEEQARVTNNLAGAMQTISSITLQTSAGAQETASTLQGMVNLSEQLNEAISSFRVTEDHVHPFAYGPSTQNPG